MNRIVLFVIVIISCFQALMAQPMERSREERPGFLLYEGISRASEDSTLSRVDIPYRIDHEFLVPVKNDDTSIPWPFVRKGELAIDLIDSVGVSRARAITQVLVGQNSSERTLEVKQWYQGISSFLVPPGTYMIQFEVTDLESRRNFIEKQYKVRAQDFASSGFMISTPVFVQGEPGTRFPDTLTLQNFGGSLLFGASGSLFLEVHPGGISDTSLTVSWAIREMGGGRDESREVSRDSSARIVTLRPMSVDTVEPGNGVRYVVRPGSDSRAIGVLVPLPVESLPLRIYTLELDIALGSHQEHKTVPFRTVWPDMPFTLRDVDLALDALRFIVEPDLLDSLNDGSFEERREHLETFWRLRDKTPNTAENELMTEYYRRVDFAVRHFGTMRVPDGSRTDMGKIYILFGPPTSMDRSLDPAAGFQETWIYKKRREEIRVQRSKQIRQLRPEPLERVMKPVVAITAGDFNGIGPEVALKSALHPSVRRLCTPMLVGAPAVFEFYAQRYRLPLRIHPLDGSPHTGRETWKAFALSCVESSSVRPGSSIKPGRVSRLAGTASARAVETAVRLVQIGVAEAIVTAPVSKRAMHLAGVKFPGQTEMLQHLTGAPRVVMMLACSALRVGLITIHLPIAEVARRISGSLIRERVQVIHEALRTDWGIRHPPWPCLDSTRTPARAGIWEPRKTN